MITNHFNPRTREGCDVFHRPSGRNGWENFNPRTREGCDMGPVFASRSIRKISIHAPVKGATPGIYGYAAADEYFNPRTREGCDGPTELHSGPDNHFNPRTREGCDAIVIVQRERRM